MLETLSWIAAVVAVPVAVVGWFESGERTINNSSASRNGIAICGDSSAFNINLTINQDTQRTEHYERRYGVFQATGKALNEALSDEMISTKTFQSFSKAVTDS
jgi:hypothetical protein